MSDKHASNPKSTSAAFARAREPEPKASPPEPEREERTDLRTPRLVMEDPHPSWAVPTRHRPDLLFPSVPPAPAKPMMTREAFDKAREISIEAKSQRPTKDTKYR